MLSWAGNDTFRQFPGYHPDKSPQTHTISTRTLLRRATVAVLPLQRPVHRTALSNQSQQRPHQRHKPQQRSLLIAAPKMKLLGIILLGLMATGACCGSFTGGWGQQLAVAACLPFVGWLAVLLAASHGVQ
jgi:hypothetical protein